MCRERDDVKAQVNTLSVAFNAVQKAFENANSALSAKDADIARLRAIVEIDLPAQTAKVGEMTEVFHSRSRDADAASQQSQKHLDELHQRLLRRINEVDAGVTTRAKAITNVQKSLEQQDVAARSDVHSGNVETHRLLEGLLTASSE